MTASDPRPRAVIRTTPEDFVVEEIPAYEPSGHGEHLFVTFEKRVLTTPDALRTIARALDVDPRAASVAGLKDRHAVTTQTASFHAPKLADAAARALAISSPGLRVIAARRHEAKLKPGHLRGNRFRIVLRGIEPDLVDTAAARLRALGRTGVPNRFGPQRFGRDGDNPERALAWLSGTARGPRDRRDQRLLFSALQAFAYNRLLDLRVADGSWSRVLGGDLAKKHDTGGLFLAPLEGPELEDAARRADEGLVSPTGPMFGAKMRWPEGRPAELERECLAAMGISEARLGELRHLGEGTRRSLRMMVSDLTVSREAAGTGLTVSFVLPKGGYATTVLAEACEIVDATRTAGATDPPEDNEQEAAQE